MQITLKSTRIIKEGLQKDDKTPYKWISVMSDDGSEKGTEYTTFDAGILNHGPGTVIDIGDPVVKEGKLSFKKFTVITEGAAPAPAEAAAPAKTEDRPGMTPELWAEKDRLERWSRESNACFMGLPELLKADPAEGKAKEAYALALDYAMAHFRLPNPAAKAPPRAAVPTAKPDPETDEDWDAVGAFANQGEFYSACLKRWNLQKSKVDAEIVGIDLGTVEGRQVAWRIMVEVMKKPPE